jgi:uroporphyrinogen decarboxylase
MDLDPDHRAFCTEGDFAVVGYDPPADPDRFRACFDDLPECVVFSCWGVGRLAQQTEQGWHAGHKMYHPLAGIDTVDGLDRYPFPDVRASDPNRELGHRVRRLQEDGYTVLGNMSQTVLETAYEMRGMPQLFVDFYERPRYVETLFGKILEQRLVQARRLAEAGVDILRIGDDIASQEGLIVGLDLYRDWIRPHHAAVISEARAIRTGIPVKYHSDGNLTPLLPDLIDIGVTIINPAQPECMDLREVKREFGRDLTLWGCMPVQSTFQHGSAEGIERHVDFLMEHIAPDGGFVASFINFLATERSTENLVTFLQMFYEKGRYETRG